MHRYVRSTTLERVIWTKERARPIARKSTRQTANNFRSPKSSSRGMAYPCAVKTLSPGTVPLTFDVNAYLEEVLFPTTPTAT